MTKRDEKPDQLSLPLSIKEVAETNSFSASAVPKSKVAVFLDAGTLALRRNAVKRVERAGIFRLNQKK